MPNDRHNTTIRMNEEERRQVEEKMNQYGFNQLSAFFRFAVRQLPKKR